MFQRASGTSRIPAKPMLPRSPSRGPSITLTRSRPASPLTVAEHATYPGSVHISEVFVIRSLSVVLWPRNSNSQGFGGEMPRIQGMKLGWAELSERLRLRLRHSKRVRRIRIIYLRHTHSHTRVHIDFSHDTSVGLFGKSTPLVFDDTSSGPFSSPRDSPPHFLCRGWTFSLTFRRHTSHVSLRQAPLRFDLAEPLANRKTARHSVLRC